VSYSCVGQLTFRTFGKLSRSCFIQKLNPRFVSDVHASIAHYVWSIGVSYSSDFHKPLDGVVTVADVFSWIRLGFLPAVLSSAHPLSSGLSAARPLGLVDIDDKVQFHGYDRKSPIPSDFLRTNHLIGSIRLAQTASTARGTEGFECDLVFS